jgi:SAM-dependent methyltransferase
MTLKRSYYEFESRLMAKCHSENSKRYADAHILRFFHTFTLIKSLLAQYEGKVTVLDIGPFLPFTLTCKEILEEAGDKTIETSIIELPGRKELQSTPGVEAKTFCNIEQETPTLNPTSFDLVLMCEILEHFIEDPFHALCQVYQLLRAGGEVVLSTPNVASLRKRMKLCFGRNIYDLCRGHLWSSQP